MASTATSTLPPTMPMPTPTPRCEWANDLPKGRARERPGDLLAAKLAAVLPQGHTFGVYHLSTPPSLTDPLFPAPPDQSADRTYLEQHFVAITIDAAAGTVEGPVIVFALEVFVFTTAFSSTFFVAKADSSGYLHQLGLPRGTQSPVRAVSSAFLSFLVEHRQRPGVPSVISLFARAQAQYLFPGSVDNKGKHVLDDRGLVKWWCRVLDRMIGDVNDAAGGNEADKADKADKGDKDDKDGKVATPWKNATGYLVVPGLDAYEMRAFLPRTAAGQLPTHWTLGDPLEKISHYVRDRSADAPVIPPRCLIPRFPDDPKARYVEELDVEVKRAGRQRTKTMTASRCEYGNGQWKGVRTLEQFWEMMAFRQECSSGRLTGFLWVVLEPRTTAATGPTAPQPTVPRCKKKKPVLRGIIEPLPPRVKTHQYSHLARTPKHTAYYDWPTAGRGTQLVSDKLYTRINELLLQLDFSTIEKAIISSCRWITEAGLGSEWRREAQGEQESPRTSVEAAVPTASKYTTSSADGRGASTGVIANDLSSLVKKRKRVISNAVAPGNGVAVSDMTGNGTTSGGFPIQTGDDAKLDGTAAPDATPRVNVLSTGLIRKKPKTAT